jgi:hypothetical protein
MSEPMWCDVRQHYCRCHDFGKRCDEDLDGVVVYCACQVEHDEEELASLRCKACGREIA